MAEKIKQIVEKMIRKHGTNNPFEIASQKGIVLLFEPLGGIYGYHHTFRRIQIIHINDELDEPMKRFVCAHELGHAVLHPELSTSFLAKKPHFSAWTGWSEKPTNLRWNCFCRIMCCIHTAALTQPFMRPPRRMASPRRWCI